jgi:hypothetical protein
MYAPPFREKAHDNILYHALSARFDSSRTRRSLVSEGRPGGPSRLVSFERCRNQAAVMKQRFSRGVGARKPVAMRPRNVLFISALSQKTFLIALTGDLICVKGKGQSFDNKLYFNSFVPCVG